MDSQIKKRNRCVSFSNEEKILIANICTQYKNIIENKKTDRISSEDKNRVWEKIAEKVNSAALNSTHRTADEVKRFYENRKREVRKIAAEEKKDLYTTDGGEAKKFKKDACHDIILSMMNTKTVYGLDNPYDGDVEPPQSPAIANPSTSQLCNDIDIIFETTDSAADGEQSTRSWRKYIPSDLKTDTSTPHSKKKQTYSASRRRPTSPIRALARSDLAKKYDTLLERRLELTLLQKKKIEEELLTIETERELKCELYKLQIEVEKQKLTKLRGSTLF